MVVMPKSAPHEKNGYAYMNYLLTPQVIANISNSVHYANPNLAADQYVVPAVKQDLTMLPAGQCAGQVVHRGGTTYGHRTVEYPVVDQAENQYLTIQGTE